MDVGVKCLGEEKERENRNKPERGQKRGDSFGAWIRLGGLSLLELVKCLNSKIKRKKKEGEEGRVFGVDEGVAPEDGLGHEQQGCAEGGDFGQPAFGECVKCPDASEVGEKVNEMAKIGKREGKEGAEIFGGAVHEHDVERAVVTEVFANEIDDALLRPCGVGVDRFDRIFLQRLVIPAFAVLVEGEETNEQADRKDDENGIIFFHIGPHGGEPPCYIYEGG